MKPREQYGMTLVELLVAMTIASFSGAMILHMVIEFESRILVEMRRNDLHDRTERLIRFIAKDLRTGAFLLGSKPVVPGATGLALVHDSLPGDPLELLPFSLIPLDVADGDDRLTLIRSESFSPPLRLLHAAELGETTLTLNRPPNRPPGSTREILPAPEAINHLVVANQRACYPALDAEQTLHLEHPLTEGAPSGTEVLGVRAYTYALDPVSGSRRLRRDDFTSRQILDDAVDGLQFEYLLADGRLVSQPGNPDEIRGVKIHLLVRSLRQDRRYLNNTVYTLGNRTYGPFRDNYRRRLATQLVEVKNHDLP